MQMLAVSRKGAAAFQHATGVVPHLVAVLVGDDPASAVYVRNKRLACDECGCRWFDRSKNCCYECGAVVAESQQREFAEIIRTSGDALLTIINDILDFSKIEAGRMDIESHPFDLRECVESALDLVSPRAIEKHLDIAYLFDRFLDTMTRGVAALRGLCYFPSSFGDPMTTHTDASGRAPRATSMATRSAARSRCA